MEKRKTEEEDQEENQNPEVCEMTMELERMRQIWSRTSYTAEAKNYLPLAGRLVEGTAVGSDGNIRVLDVGCGTGNVAVTAARCGARATGVDITPEMLEKARKNARIAGVEERVEWSEGDATDLPFGDDAFDATLSCLGHMYGDPPEKAAGELLRVTRPGGRVGFTSWTPSGLYPSMAGIVTTYLSPDDLPEFSAPPFMWGDSGTVENRLGDGVEGTGFETDTLSYPALSPEHFWRKTVARSGMFAEFLEKIDDEDLRELEERIIETIEDHFDESVNAVELEYLLTEATVK